MVMTIWLEFGQVGFVSRLQRAWDTYESLQSPGVDNSTLRKQLLGSIE